MSYITQNVTSSPRQIKQQTSTIDELNTHTPSPLRATSRTQTFKNIFSFNKDYKKKKQHSKSTKAKLNELFKSTNHSKSPLISTNLQKKFHGNHHYKLYSKMIYY
eukprot:759200_1